MPLLFFDDFNSYALAAPPPSPWVLSVPTGSQIDVEADPQAGSPQGRVTRVFQTSGVAAEYIYRPFSAQSKVTCDIKIRAAQTNQRLHVGLILDHSTSIVANFVPIFCFDTDGFINRGVGPGLTYESTAHFSYAADTWYSFRIAADLTAGGFNATFVRLDDNASNAAKAGAVYAVGLGVLTDSSLSASGTWFIDDARAAPTYVTHSGIVRDAATGVPIVGATIYAVRQSDLALLASATSGVNGAWTMTLPSPDDIKVTFVALNGLTDPGSGRPWVTVF